MALVAGLIFEIFKISSDSIELIESEIGGRTVKREELQNWLWSSTNIAPVSSAKHLPPS